VKIVVMVWYDLRILVFGAVHTMFAGEKKKKGREGEGSIYSGWKGFCV
jgi:hypothetical protein